MNHVRKNQKGLRRFEFSPDWTGPRYYILSLLLGEGTGNRTLKRGKLQDEVFVLCVDGINIKKLKKAARERARRRGLSAQKG